jgi:hypothetical protein
MSTDPDLHRHHPLNLVWALVRGWLLGIVFLMGITAVTARPLLLQPPLRALPFVGIAATAFWWYLHPRSGHTTAVCSAIIAVGLELRGIEILLFSDTPFPSRCTPWALWTALAATALGLGVVASIVISKRYADIEVWGR